MLKEGLKRMLSMLLVFIMVFGLCGLGEYGEVKAAGGVVFTVAGNKQVAQRGDEIRVTVNMTGNTSAENMRFRLQYDDQRLELVASNCSQMGGLADLNVNANPILLGAIRNGSPLSDGEIVSLTFRVRDNAAAGSLIFTPAVIELQDGSGNNVDQSIANNTAGMKVSVPITGISLDHQTLELTKGQTGKLTAGLTPEGAEGTVTWSSNNNAVASVASDGTVTAKTAGTAVITATAEGKSASCTVNVTIPLNSITVTGATHTIKKGQTLQLSVTYDPIDTTENKTVTWETSDSAVATVDRNGLVTAVADGSATISAKVGSKTADYAVTVEEKKLTSISIKSETTIHRGDSETLAVIYEPEDTTDDKTVQWTSSDETKVGVDGSGRVTAVAIGGADVTAKVGSHTATCRVSVDAPLESIIPAENVVDMVKNQTAMIAYTLNPADTTDLKDITFTSSAPEIAAVNSSTGEVTANKEGSTVITLSGANGKTAEVTVNVTEIPIDRVTLNRQSAVVEKGDTVELIATIGPDNTTDDDTGITWTSSDASVAGVSPLTSASGAAVTVTATNKGGTATITASAANGTKAVFELAVLIHMESISLPGTATIDRGSTRVLEVTYSPANTTDDKTVTWTSSDASVAKVDPDTGTITALKEGTATITATTTKTTVPYSAQTTVTVQEHHLDEGLGDAIEFEDMDMPVLRGQQYNMYRQMNLSEIIDENAITDDITIQWSSSDPEIATIDQSGNVTGLKKGKTTITAVITAKDGSGNLTGEYTVSTEISIKEIPLDSIAFNKVITEMQVGATDVLGIIYNPSDTTDLRNVVWSSSDPNVISVDNGRITARRAGVVEITAKVGDKSVTCKITVKENGNAGIRGTNTRNGSRTNVQTGDTASIALYLVLLILSVAAMAVCYVIRGRRVKRNR